MEIKIIRDIYVCIVGLALLFCAWLIVLNLFAGWTISTFEVLRIILAALIGILGTTTAAFIWVAWEYFKGKE